MTFDAIRFVLYRYIYSTTQRGKELSEACRAIGHGRIEITIQDGKVVQINVLGTMRQDATMEQEIAKLTAHERATVPLTK